MAKNITLSEAAADRWKKLVDLIFAEATEHQYSLIDYIHNGYMKSWAPAHRNDPDAGIKAYSTALKWQQYQDGKISREKAVDYAVNRAEAETIKHLNSNVEKLNAAALADSFTWARIVVEWRRSRMWGANPAADVILAGAHTTGYASGCGYDKESAAVAEALNENPAALAMLYDLAESALNRGESPRSADSCSGFRWEKPIAYGAGYSVLPYFERGVGVSCFFRMFEKAGYTARCTGSGKMFDCYEINKEV